MNWLSEFAEQQTGKIAVQAERPAAKVETTAPPQADTVPDATAPPPLASMAWSEEWEREAVGARSGADWFAAWSDGERAWWRRIMAGVRRQNRLIVRPDLIEWVES